MRTLSLSGSFACLAILLVGCPGERPADLSDAGGPPGGGTTTIRVGGTVSGLEGTGFILQNNGSDDAAISADGPFTFSRRLATGSPFNVTVSTQPTSPAQVCTVANGQGTAGSTDVSSIQVTCSTSAYPIGGTVTGLAGRVRLQLNGGDDLEVTQNGGFAFATPIASGSGYVVTVRAQPSSPSQTCLVSNGTGTMGAAPISSVQIDCTTNSFQVGGTVSGLAGVGLTLRNNGGAPLAVSFNGAFVFPAAVQSGGAYSITIDAPPTSPWQTCAVSNASGVVTTAPVMNVMVTCTTNTYPVGGTVSGLTGNAVVLQNNGGDALSVTQDGAFVFATPVESGATYAVTIFANPTGPSQSCTVTSGGGVVTSSAVTDVAITCVTGTYAIGGTVAGLTGTVVLRNNGADDLAVSSNGPFAFPTRQSTGSSYSVTVFSHPSSPAQFCAVANGTGSVGTADVTTVSITCMAPSSGYSVGGTLQGLTSGNSLVLHNNGADALTLSANGTFTFPTLLASGASYAATLFTQPSGQSCTVANGSGTVGTSNVTNISVFCASGNSITFSYTGAVQSFAVPSGVNAIQVLAYGAQGGAGDVSGGLGGQASATIPVTPGETLNIYVGGAGGTMTSTMKTLAGGFNGGGSVHECCGAGLSGAGGGASDVRRGTALADRLIVAGGGGGGAWSSTSGTGGGGGGLVGITGNSSQTTYKGGGGGTQTAGGASLAVLPNYPNTPGSLGQGGEAWRDTAGSGGGGGGYYGGGGGEFAGGGGGSSYLDAPGNTAKSTTSAVRSGDGQVIISW